MGTGVADEHFVFLSEDVEYEKRDKGYAGEKTGDLQKIDVGIALCHFAMGLEEMGAEHEISISDPGIAVPDGVEYIATVRKL